MLTRFQVRRKHIRSPRIACQFPVAELRVQQHFYYHWYVDSSASSATRLQKMSSTSRNCTRKVKRIWRVPKKSYRIVSASPHDHMVCLILTEIGTRNSVVRCPMYLIRVISDADGSTRATAVDWKVSMYILFCAWIVNFGLVYPHHNVAFMLKIACHQPRPRPTKGSGGRFQTQARPRYASRISQTKSAPHRSCRKWWSLAVNCTFL